MTDESQGKNHKPFFLDEFESRLLSIVIFCKYLFRKDYLAKTGLEDALFHFEHTPGGAERKTRGNHQLLSFRAINQSRA